MSVVVVGAAEVPPCTLGVVVAVGVGAGSAGCRASKLSVPHEAGRAFCTDIVGKTGTNQSKSRTMMLPFGSVSVGFSKAFHSKE